MARKKKKVDEPIVGEVVDLRGEAELAAEKELAEEAARAEPAQGPVSLRLTTDEMRDLQLFQALARAASAETQLETMKRDMLLKQIDPDGRLTQYANTLRALCSQATEAKLSYEAVRGEIERRLGIKLAEFSYDDETGMLMKMNN